MQIQSGPPLDEMSIGCILRDLLHAVEYLHNEGKIHRDIKGSFQHIVVLNILHFTLSEISFFYHWWNLKSLRFSV